MVVRGKIVNLVGQHLADQLCNRVDIQDIKGPFRHVAVNAITGNTNDPVPPRCQFAAKIVAILPTGTHYDCAALHTRKVFRLLKLELAHDQYGYKPMAAVKSRSTRLLAKRAIGARRSLH